MAGHGDGRDVVAGLPDQAMLAAVDRPGEPVLYLVVLVGRADVPVRAGDPDSATGIGFAGGRPAC